MRRRAILGAPEVFHPGTNSARRRAPRREPTVRVAVGLMILIALGAPARAQPAEPGPSPPPLSETLTGDAKTDYDAARQQLADRDFEGALGRFTRLYAEVHDARLLANVALCEKSLSRCARAIPLFDQALSTGGGLFSPSQAADIRAMAQDCDSRVGRLRITGAPAGAAVEIDDVATGPTAAGSDIVVDAGVHRVRVTRAGYRDLATAISVSAGDRVELAAHLRSVMSRGGVSASALFSGVASPATLSTGVASFGAVAVRTGPLNAVALDGRIVGKGNWEGRVVAGDHTISVTADGMDPYRADIRVTENQTRSLDITLGAARGAGPWMWATGGAVVLVGAVVAIVSVFRPADPVGPTQAVGVPPSAALRR